MPRKFVKVSIIFLIIFSNTFSSVLPLFQFKVSAEYGGNGWVPGEDCMKEQYWPYNYPIVTNDGEANDYICYIRGVLNAHPDPLLTTPPNYRIQYPNFGGSPRYFNFYISASGDPYNRWRSYEGQEVIAKVEYTNSFGGFDIIDIEPAYEPNQAPLIPSLVYPINLSEFSGNCDESVVPATGTCRIGRNIDLSGWVGDPDIRNEYKHQESWFYFNNLAGGPQTYSGAIPCPGDCNNNVYQQIYLTQGFTDGRYSWGISSRDIPGAVTSSGAIQFTTDTTPPPVPALNALPTWTKAVGIEQSKQVELTFNKVNDNITPQNEVGYIAQYSKNPSFSPAFTLPSQSFNLSTGRIEIGPKGADGVAGNPDDIVDGQTYYFRIKAHDKTNYAAGQKNTSAWSNVVSTKIDGILPVIIDNSLGSTLDRFSPNNSTSVGIEDEAQFIFRFVEANPKVARVEIYNTEVNSLGNPAAAPVRILSQNLTVTPPKIGFVWDGKDSNGNYVHDGSYIAFAVVEDQAGNLSYGNVDLNQTNVPWKIVKVDNNEANISISSPFNEFWSKRDNIDLTGQVTAPRDPGPDGVMGTIDDELDEDIASFEITNLQSGDIENTVYDSQGFFTYNTNLNVGPNSYFLKTVDTVGNQKELSWTVNFDNIAPEILNVSPEGKLQKGEPSSISFTVQDIGSGVNENSDIAIGTNPKGISVWMEYKVLDNTQPKPYPEKILRMDLINFTEGMQNGSNESQGLVSDLVCEPEVGETTNIKNQISTSKIVNCKLNFLRQLQPDSEYRIFVEASDVAGNQTQNSEKTFVVDTNIFSELSAPVENGIYSTSSLLFKGKASKNSELKIANQQLGEERQFTLNEGLNNSGKDSSDNKFISSDFTVSCGEFIDVDGRSDTPDEEVCNWEVYVRQSFSNEDIDTINNNRITVSDEFGNVKFIDVNFIVNLFKFDLEVQSDKEYFSPNGDGKQDTILFTHSAINPYDEFNPPIISSYKVSIQDKLGNSIRDFSGTGNLPTITYFDGFVQDISTGEWKWLADGEYQYILEVTTSDGAVVSTTPKNLFAKSILTDEVVITSPITNMVTTNGIIFIEGQAPKSDSTQIGELLGEIWVDLCIDSIVAGSLSCDNWISVKAAPNGYFNSGAITLPRFSSLARVEHMISATARDSYGNQTPKSNEVKVILDTIDPFVSVSLTPSLTGITNSEDYAKFLNGEISIDQIRNVKLVSVVTQNTQAVQLSYADFTNLIERPNNVSYDFIATINNESETDPKLNPYGSNTIKKNHEVLLSNLTNENICSDPNNCTWEYFLPINPTLGGTYEIEFTGKKAEKVETMTAGFKVDGSIPAAPYLMIIEKCMDRKSDSTLPLEDSCNDNWYKLDNVNMNHYTDGGLLRFSGAAEPGTLVEIKNGTQVLGSMIVGENGIFQIYIDLDHLMSLSPEEGGLSCTNWDPIEQKCKDGNISFDIIGKEFDENGNLINEVPAENGVDITFDIIDPEILSIIRTTNARALEGWARTGDQARFNITTSEKLVYGSLIKESDFVRILALLENKQNNQQVWSEVINIDRPEEGYYYPRFNIIDMAGNLNSYDAKSCDTKTDAKSTICDYRIYIDNTRPDDTAILKESWSGMQIEGGYNADGVFPEIGRTNPHYVTRSNKVLLKGKAEKNQRVEIFVNSNLQTTVSVSSNNCTSDGNTDKLGVGGLVTKYAEKCDWSYEYEFRDNGANTWEGVPTNFYLFQVRTLDAAANVSNFGPTEIVFHDTSKPTIPDLVEVKSGSYKNTIPDWSVNISADIKPITRDLNITMKSVAERLSDMKYFVTDPKGNKTESPIFMNDSDRIHEKDFSLGSQKDQRSGCMSIQGNKRIGTCEDGNYNFSLQIADAAGNVSDKRENIVIERDTVAPAVPVVNIEKRGTILEGEKLTLSISGESSTTAQITIRTQNSVNYRSVRLDASGRFNMDNYIGLECGNISYQISVKLIDRAGNISESSLPKTIQTIECPSCGTGDGLLFQKPIHKSSAGLTSKFGLRQINGKLDFHTGWDYGSGVSKGDAIFPVMSGKVIHSNYNVVCDGSIKGNEGCWALGLANSVVVEHSSNIRTYYGHLLNEPGGFVKTGDLVTVNDQVGRLGSMGASTGPHLHFEIKIRNQSGNWIAVDPAGFMKSDTNLSDEEYAQFCPKNQGSSSEYPNNISKDDAVNLFTLFIQIQLGNQTELGDDHWNPTTDSYKVPNTKVSDINNLNRFLNSSVHFWDDSCVASVWVQDLGEVFDNMGEKIGSDGILIINPWNKKVYLVKDKIWKKYRDNKGPCGLIGVPHDTNGGYTEVPIDNKTNSTIDWGVVQRFKKGSYENQSIYSYRWVLPIISQEPKYIERTHFIVKTISDIYEARGGTASKTPGLPKSDTELCHPTSTLTKQKFSENEINLCDFREITHEIEEPFQVTGGFRPDNSTHLKGTYVDPNYRTAQLSLSDTDRGKTIPNGNLWVLSHGWNSDDGGIWRDMANSVKKLKPNDIVLTLNWSEGSVRSFGDSLIDQGNNFEHKYNCQAVTWSRPTALGVKSRLDKVFKLDKGQKKLNTIGHSFGSFLVTELSSEYSNSISDTLIALDPAKESGCGNFNFLLKSFPANPFFGDYTTSIDYENETTTRKKDFKYAARFVRSFVGKWSLGGDQDHAKTADEAITINFDYGLDKDGPFNEHTMVVQAYADILRHEAENKEKLFDKNIIATALHINDTQKHDDWVAEPVLHVTTEKVDGKIRIKDVVKLTTTTGWEGWEKLEYKYTSNIDINNKYLESNRQYSIDKQYGCESPAHYIAGNCITYKKPLGVSVSGPNFIDPYTRENMELFRPSLKKVGKGADGLDRYSNTYYKYDPDWLTVREYFAYDTGASNWLHLADSLLAVSSGPKLEDIAEVTLPNYKYLPKAYRDGAEFLKNPSGEKLVSAAGAVLEMLSRLGETFAKMQADDRYFYVYVQKRKDGGCCYRAIVEAWMPDGFVNTKNLSFVQPTSSVFFMPEYFGGFGKSNFAVAATNSFYMGKPEIRNGKVFIKLPLHYGHGEGITMTKEEWESTKKFYFEPDDSLNI